MPLPSFTYIFVAGTTIDSAQVNTNNNNMISNMTDGTRDFTIGTITTTGAASFGSDVTLGATTADDVIFNTLTASTVPYIDASKIIKSSAVSPTELGFLAGITALGTLTDWGATPWTPTGSFTTNTTYTGSYRRVNDEGQFRVHLAFAGVPNSITALEINLPASHTIDTTKLVGSTASPIVGWCLFADGSTFYTGFVTYETTTTVRLRVHFISTFTGNVYTKLSVSDENDPFTIGSGDAINAYFAVPIVEYA